MKLLLLSAALFAALGAHVVLADPVQQRSFYERDGSFAGSSTTYGDERNTSLYDRNSHFAGSAIRNSSDGSMSYFDRSGHFTGSSRR
jgi:hypothetical protein